ncbi:polysaccharide deacetylase family protein [Leptospira alexanderi]|uniref:polysaccharide deacetylase family protein n=1 Tax=Leptospira alexanderi TaxID=100053 RepID=UPI000990C46F|nr:polysaccharide deacetylase family protein [Leptospira alexanderi]
MFHHFHGGHHLPVQGSLSASDFNNMLDWLNSKYTVLNANDFIVKYLKGNLRNEDICLSFDDALLCQYDIAFPILKERGISAFFFVYSSAFTMNPDYLEIYRYFRAIHFGNIDNFYDEFFEQVCMANDAEYAEAHEKYKTLDYLSAFPFYSETDRWFRYLRDQFLEETRYHELMKNLMESKKFDVDEAKKNLWMNEDCLRELHSHGNIIGLHSYSHPTQMSKLSFEKQVFEYSRNLLHLEGILGKGVITSMSHPCGDYNDDTLGILTDLGIKIGFRSNRGIKEIRSALEIPREDHANIYREMHS